MIRTQIYLTVDEKDKLLHLSRESGIHQSALIREAIDQFIESKLAEKKKKHDALEAAAGLWADRSDLPDFTDLRKEFDRLERNEKGNVVNR
jgi:predicted transcriptional regulator